MADYFKDYCNTFQTSSLNFLNHVLKVISILSLFCSICTVNISLTTSCRLYTLKLSNSSNKCPANLNTKTECFHSPYTGYVYEKLNLLKFTIISKLLLSLVVICRWSIMQFRNVFEIDIAEITKHYKIRLTAISEVGTLNLVQPDV